MEIKNLKGVGITEILNVFNKSFEDYFVPFRLTEDQFITKMASDKVKLALSVGVFDHQKLIGFILHGIDIINNQKIIYNAATGVIPENRGAGLTKKMYGYVLPYLKESGIDQIVLEVISKNTPAIKSYERVGFVASRELACFKGEFRCRGLKSDVEIKDLSEYNWTLMRAFWDINTTWQNSISVLNEVKSNLISLGAFMGNQLVAYVIYLPQRKLIQQIAVDKNNRRKGLGTKLISELAKKYGNRFSVLNVDKKAKNAVKFFGSTGFENFIEQIEMHLKFTSKSNYNGHA